MTDDELAEIEARANAATPGALTCRRDAYANGYTLERLGLGPSSVVAQLGGR